MYTIMGVFEQFCKKANALAAMGGLAVTGLAVFIVYFVTAFQRSKVYEYSSPLSAMWAGIGTLWYNATFLTWWIFKEKHVGWLAVKVWTGISILFATEGFISLIGWAVAQKEGDAAGWTSLWIFSGVLGTLMCWRNKGMNTDVDDHSENSLSAETRAANRGKGQAEGDVLDYIDDNESQEVGQTQDEFRVMEVDNEYACEEAGKADDNESPCCKGCKCCCSAQFWLDFGTLFVATVLLAFSTGFMVQSIMSAYDTNTLSKHGRVYSITSNGVDLKMHLNCFGGSGNDEVTVIFEHGGGANSLSLLAIGQELVSKYGNRVCLYDRLGYGFTPSLYAGGGRLPNTGVLLSVLLAEAGETGPFVCAGHSAGVEACLWFAAERGDVKGVALMDGYPDLIRPGTFRPGQPANPGLLGALQGFCVMAGPTGLTRGLVGNPGPNFVPTSEKRTMTALYAQVRFFFAQYWDVRRDLDVLEEDRLYVRLNGTQDERGLFHYGGSLTGLNVLVIPAASTVQELDCTKAENKRVYCCGEWVINSTQCRDQRSDRMLYRDQSYLYATTLSDIEGSLVIAPNGTDHAMPYHKDFYQWIAEQIGKRLL